MDISSIKFKIKNFFSECKRVWIVTRNPTNEEFKTITKVTGIGIIIIGMIGFLINVIWQVGLK